MPRKAPTDPAWRARFENPSALHDPIGKKIAIPMYLQRWLLMYGNKRVEEMIPEILEQAMLMHVRSMLPVAGEDYVEQLICGRYVSGDEASLCEALFDDTLKQKYGILNRVGVVCVSNGIYGYFYAIDIATQYRIGHDAPGAGSFQQWLYSEYPAMRDKLTRKNLDGPVIRLPKGEWPTHPRLTPGHPWGVNLEFK